MASAARIEARLASPDLELQAERSEGFGARSIGRENTAASLLTAARIVTLLTDAEGGDIAAQSELFEYMEEKDEDIGAFLSTRKATVARGTFEIDVDERTPDDQVKRAEEMVEFCQEILADIPKWRQARKDMLDAVGKGFSVCEIEWRKDAQLWQPARLIYRPQRWFSVAEDGDSLLIRGGAGEDDQPMNPLNFVVHRSIAQSGFLWRTALLRRCVRPFIIRHYSWRDWMRFAELYGTPARIGHLPDDVAWDSPEATQLYAAVRAFGHDFAAVVSGASTIELLELQRGEGLIYDRLINVAQLALARTILGQTLSSGGESGGSYALGQVHQTVRQDIAEEDADDLGETITDQLLRPLVQLNHGVDAPVPVAHIIVERAKDLKAQADTYSVLANAGARISLRQVNEEFGIWDAEEDEEIMVPLQMQVLGMGGGGGTPEPEQEEEEQEAEAQMPLALRTRGDILAQADLTETGPVPEDGLAWLTERRVVDEAAWEQLSPAGRQRVWYASGLPQERIAAMGEEMIAAFAAGETPNQVLTRLEARGVSVPGGQEPGDGQIAAAHARLVDRQSRYAGYSADRWIKAERAREERPYAQYHTAGDERVRPEHAALDGVVKPLDDPFWASYWPPWDFNCRCTATTVSPAEMESEGLAVADEWEEAARYQAALLLQGEPTSQEVFGRGWKNLMPVLREQGADPAALKAPAKAAWQFDRRDAFGLEAEGWTPATETGRHDLDLLRTLSTVAELL